MVLTHIGGRQHANKLEKTEHHHPLHPICIREHHARPKKSIGHGATVHGLNLCNGIPSVRFPSCIIDKVFHLPFSHAGVVAPVVLYKISSAGVPDSLSSFMGVSGERE